MSHSEAFLKIVDDAKKQVKEISMPDSRKRLVENPKAVLVDVREDSEWAKGHAAGAVHIGKGVIERDIEAKIPDHGTEMILYCGGGFRSALAAEALGKMGYTNVSSMMGGWREWVASGAPTEGM